MSINFIKYWLLLIVGLAWVPISAQVNLTNKGDDNVTISGVNVYLNGSYINRVDSLTGNSNGSLNISTGDSLFVTGDFINQTSSNVINGNNTVVLNGNGTQEISGDSSFHFYQLVIDKNAGDLTLYQSIDVINDLVFNAGNLDLNNYDLNLGITGSLINESSGSKILNTFGLVKATRLFSGTSISNDQAGLGFYIQTSNNFSFTDIKRGHTEQTGAGDGSVKRYWDLSPSNTGLSVDAIKLHYFHDDLDGIPQNELSFWQTNTGGSIWSNKYGTLDTLANTITANNLTLSNSIFTASRFDCDTNPNIALPDTSHLCPGQSVVLDAGNPSHLYAWSTGASTQTISASSTGTYYVTVTSVNGCQSDDSTFVKLENFPNASFTAISACLGDTISFNNSSSVSGASLSYFWDYGDATTSSDTSILQNPEYAFTNAGTYTASLVATSNYGCSDTAFLNVFQHALPIVDFSAIGTCADSTVQFANNTAVASPYAINNYSWSFGDGTTSNIAMPNHAYSSIGNYTVNLIASTNAGCVDSTTELITVYPNPTAAFTLSNACEGTDVAINNNSSVSSGSLSYHWSFGDGSSSTSGNPSKTYSIADTFDVVLTANSGLGCLHTDTQSVVIFDVPSAAFLATNSCLNDSVVFSENATGTDLPFSYAWQFGDGNSANSQNAIHAYVASANYNAKLIISSANGCADSVSNTVQVYPQPNASFNTNNQCLGTLHQFVNNSNINSGTLSYLWDLGDGSNSSLVTPNKLYSASGSFTVNLIATSNKGCTDTANMTTVVNQLPNVNIGDSISTCGTSISLDAQNTGANFTWNTLATSQVINVTSNGTYTVTVSDTNGCANSDAVYVQLNTSPSISLGADVTACASYTLSVPLTNSTFLWNTGDTTSSIAVTNSNDYWVSIVDQNGCSSSDTINVGILSYPTVSLGANDTICQGDSVLLNAQNAGAAFSWNSGQASQQISAFTTGDYTVTVTDSICSSSATVHVEVNPIPNINLGSDSGYCVSHTIIAGDSNQSYLWNTGDTSNQITVTNTASYSVTASNQYGCLSVDSVHISIYNLPQISLGADSNFCASDSFLINPTISESVNYLWNNGTSDSTLTAFSGGVYHLTVTNANECSASDTISLSTNPLPLVAFAFANNCADSSIAFTNNSSIGAGNIQSYQWTFGDGNTSSNTSPTHNYNTAGTYTVNLIATSDLGCIDSATSNLSVYPNPTANLDADSVCEATDINLTNNSSIISGSMNYGWAFGDGQTSTLPSPAKNYGTYGSYLIRLTATSNHGCIAKDTQTVMIYDVPNAQFNTASVCEYDSALLVNTSSVNNATMSYAWQFGDGVSSTNTSPKHEYGTYATYTISLVATSSFGCIDNASGSVTINEAPNASFLNNNACLNQANSFINTSSINTGSLVYEWNFGNGTSASSVSTNHVYNAAGNYNVKLKVTSNLGCQDSITQSTTVHNLPIVNLGDTISTCGGSLVLDAQNSGANYNWNTFATTQTITTTLNGNYSATVTDANGCVASDTVNVMLNTASVTNLGADINACGSYVIDAFSPGGTYAWSTGESTASILVSTTGNYSVTVTDQNNCISNDTILVTVTPNPIVDLGADDTICDGQVLVLDAQNAGANYQWSSNAGSGTTQTVTIGNTGVYSVSVSQNGCVIADTISILINPTPTVLLGANGNYCDEHWLVATNANSSYLWSTNDTADSILVINSGSYNVTVTNAFGCSLSDTIALVIFESPLLSLGNDTALCQGESFTITPEVNQVVNFTWGNSSTDSIRTVSATGNYVLTVTNSNGCAGLDSVNVTVNALPNVELGSTIILLNGDTATLQTSDSTWQHQWFDENGFAGNGPIFSTADSGTYSVIVIDSNGCSATDSVFVNALNQSLVARFICVSQAQMGDTIQFVQLSYPDPLQYLWDFGDGATSTDSSVQHTYFLEDTFQVTLVAYNNLYADTMVKNIVIAPPASNAKAIEDSLQFGAQSVFNSIILYPNPTRDFLAVEMSLKEQTEVNIQFFTLQGIPIELDQFDDKYFKKDYSFSQMPSGMYFMRVSTDREIKTFKFIKL
jgi:PKD repeat protein